MIRERVEDREDNETRFVWLARTASAAGRSETRPAQGERPPLRAGEGGEWKTSLVFWGAGAERPGWLVRCLDEFARRDINLTKIESRPRRQGLGSYMFFADLDRTRGGSAGRRGDRGRRRDVRGGAGARLLRRRVPRVAAVVSAHAAAPVARAGSAARYTAGLKMECTVPPEPVGSVSPSEHQRHGPGTSPATAMSGRVLVLNATYEPINVCTVRRAVVLLLKEKAELLERGRWELHSESSTLARPVVIRLVSYVKVPRDAHRRKITRRAVFARDSWTCQYCGSRSNLTVDHVIPRSKGGTSSWENIVASCAPCNRRKGDRLPRQAGMHPRHAPRTPRAEIFIHVASPTIPAAWLAVPAAGGVSDRSSFCSGRRMRRPAGPHMCGPGPCRMRHGLRKTGQGQRHEGRPRRGALRELL